MRGDDLDRMEFDTRKIYFVQTQRGVLGSASYIFDFSSI